MSDTTIYTEKNLFERLCKLEEKKITLAEDIKQLKADFSFDKMSNTKGIDKEVVKLVHKAAALYAKNKFEEQKDITDAVYEKYEELTGYNN